VRRALNGGTLKRGLFVTWGLPEGVHMMRLLSGGQEYHRWVEVHVGVVGVIIVVQGLERRHVAAGGELRGL
jgi:hypothetical protein